MSEARLEQHYDALLRFASRRLRSREAAIDLVQDAYVRVAAMPSKTVLLNPRAYLFGVVAHLIADHWRDRLRHPATLRQIEGLHAVRDETPDAEARALSREELALVFCAIDALPPRAQAVFRLHRFEGLTYAEIAVRLGIAKNTVMVHMMTALAQLRIALREYHEAD